jgi:hypothetical protein
VTHDSAEESQVSHPFDQYRPTWAPVTELRGERRWTFGQAARVAVERLVDYESEPEPSQASPFQRDELSSPSPYMNSMSGSAQ